MVNMIESVTDQNRVIISICIAFAISSVSDIYIILQPNITFYIV